MRIAIGEMILYKGNSDLTLGIAAAFKNHCEGKITRSEGFPIIVRYVLEENKYIIIDGYHRLVKGLLEGKTEFECCLEESDALKHLGWIPPKSHRFIIPETKRKTKIYVGYTRNYCGFNRSRVRESTSNFFSILIEILLPSSRPDFFSS